VIVVNSFDDLNNRTDAEIAGKIVLYNAIFTTYGETVSYRSSGAIRASKKGAVASLIRSVSPFDMQNPHTGSMSYDNTTRIPAAALTLEDSDLIQRLSIYSNISIYLYMEAQTMPDLANSRNVIAQITGSEKPNEIIVMGGHLDSWDVGTGAIDDGAGILVTWEALRIIQQSGLVPRRTIRVVGWTNEENGNRGAETYASNHINESHILAIESDSGIFAFDSFGYNGPKDDPDFGRNVLIDISKLITDVIGFNVSITNKLTGTTDISPLLRQGIPGATLNTNGDTYFWYHHSATDTIDKMNPEDFVTSSSALAALVYLVANVDEFTVRV